MALGKSNYDSKMYMRSARIYNKALTAQEITDIYNYEKNFRSIVASNSHIEYNHNKNIPHQAELGFECINGSHKTYDCQLFEELEMPTIKKYE